MKQKIHYTFLILPFLLLLPLGLIAQTIEGKVTDKSGITLPYMNIVEKGTKNGTTTNNSGEFSIKVKSLPTILVVSSLGFMSKEIKVSSKKYLTVVVEVDNVSLDEIVLVGSRGKPRTAFDSPVPIDNIKISELAQTGKGVLDQQLMFKVPSYNSTQQPVSDAGAHFSPADLRGLFPSRTLVLVNGKRKNASALVYSYVTPGRGEVGVDMKSIPAAALERVEILRDGAAAQYGSDAVAGVINLVMKKSVAPFINTSYSVTSEGDGAQYQLETGFGVDIADKGYVNFTFSYFDQERTQRAGKITSVEDEANYWKASSQTTQEFITDNKLEAFLQRNPSAGFQVGIPDMTITNFSYNMGYTLDEETQTEVYSFGALANRTGSAAQFARVPYWVPGFEQIYPGADFFRAEMSPQIKDNTFSLGIKTVFNGWNFDLSTTTGKNRIDYYITNSFNQSYGASSPSDFYNGAHQFSHVVNNLDLFKVYEGADDKAISVAFGVEHRTERFVTEAGELASYEGSGSESFGGFSPENVADDYRSNIGMYTDISIDLSKAFLIGGALRYENYSDFGSNVSWKLNSRWKTADDKLAIRGSVSSGFRAPSLHQMFYTARTTTLTTNGIQQNGILNNSDPALRALGIPELNPETSQSIGAGVSYRITRKIGFTADVYQVKVDDRIGLSGQVTATGDTSSPIDQTLSAANVGAVGFFLNAIDTRTRGVDLVLSYDYINLGSGQLSGSIAANFNKTEVTGFNFPKFIQDNNLQDAVFSREDISRVETWRPQQKIIAAVNYKIEKFSAGVSFMNYGKVTYRHASDASNDATYGGKTLTDINFAYNLTEKLNLSLGVNNLFNIYPDTFADAYSDTGGAPGDRNLDFVGRFKYPWQTTQFGIDGTRVFTKLAFTF
jgi:iron complex outermembrane receptor protein